MPSRYSPRDEDEYEQEDYNDYEEEGSEEGEEEGEKEEPLSKEEQEYLKLREQLKEKCRQNLKKEIAAVFGKTESKKKPVTNDNFGSFFGPSRPVIAARVLDESRCIRQNPHFASRAPKVFSDNAKDTAHANLDKKQGVHDHQPRVVNEIKKKAQTLKDMRDYSFLLSDDADFPDAKEPQPTRKIVVPNSDGRSAQAFAKSKSLASKPRRLDSNSHQSRNPSSKKIQPHNRTGSVKAAALSKPKLTTTDFRKAASSFNGSNRTVVHKPLPSKATAQITGTKKPLAKVADQLHLKSRPPSAVPHSSAQKSQHFDQKRTNQSLEKIKSALTKPPPSAKPQPSKSILQKDRHEDRLKKLVPVKRRMDDDDEEDAIGMIRKMFGYNPSKYSGVDDDDSDMEADFSEILKEERRSSKIAQKEDEEQLRLIEEEERRERMRKKQKLRR